MIATSVTDAMTTAVPGMFRKLFISMFYVIPNVTYDSTSHVKTCRKCCLALALNKQTSGKITLLGTGRAQSASGQSHSPKIHTLKSIHGFYSLHLGLKLPPESQQ